MEQPAYGSMPVSADVVEMSMLDHMNLKAMERDYDRMKKELEEAQAERKTLNMNAVHRETYDEVKRENSALRNEIILLRKQLAEAKELGSRLQLIKKNDKLKREVGCWKVLYELETEKRHGLDD